MKSYNNGIVMDVYKIKDYKKAINDWAEGDIYLEKILLLFYKKKLRSYACCAGEEIVENGNKFLFNPYILFEYSIEHQNFICCIIKSVEKYASISCSIIDDNNRISITQLEGYNESIIFKNILNSIENYDENKNYYLLLSNNNKKIIKNAMLQLKLNKMCQNEQFRLIYSDCVNKLNSFFVEFELSQYSFQFICMISKYALIKDYKIYFSGCTPARIGIKSDSYSMIQDCVNLLNQFDKTKNYYKELIQFENLKYFIDIAYNIYNEKYINLCNCVELCYEKGKIEFYLPKLIMCKINNCSYEEIALITSKHLFEQEIDEYRKSINLECSKKYDEEVIEVAKQVIILEETEKKKIFGLFS